jgi:hypothetical protein
MRSVDDEPRRRPAIQQQRTEEQLEEVMKAIILEAAMNANPDGAGNHRNVLIAAIGEPEFTRLQIVESLRGALPRKLVADVIVAGRSWDED